MSTQADASKPASSKWIPLESNPDVMNAWAEKLGLATKVSRFNDVYGLDPDLLALVPQPSKAVLLVFPLTEKIDKERRESDEKIQREGQKAPIDPTIFFIKQTIDNACGTIGLLHALGNADVTIKPMSPLAKFFEQCADETPDKRALILEHTKLFTSAHVEAATQGQTSIPADLDTDLHFVTFVVAPDPTAPIDDGDDTRNQFEKRIIELDGRRSGPVDHGPTKDETFLKDVAKIVREEFIGTSVSLEFGMISLGPPEGH
ncbi:hypothetical protein BOTBODRAFT_39452 [Botryobasidium botryosum FD-172 SS1]|uniref:Ubiquitin carboxyl-terminal hydrolase n=1 Tax=Botryobasidium botryosum (strain FD-172 SS1) TaxID=930990 RepID=A0A067LTM4_BOTB1|nr:hypothetical protein BOTBODRAFT_39452 [Botryobasidium botryosum FD-172 SS1]